MGLLGKLAQTVGENISKSKEDRQREIDFVKNNKGSEAITAYMVDLFQKGNPGYDWVKKNKVGLFPVINNDSVSLCYMQVGDGKSLSGVKPKDIEAQRFTFQEMYRWYGLPAGVGYTSLDSRTKKNVLENMIDTAVQALPHIKYNGGYMVKLFQ